MLSCTGNQACTRLGENRCRWTQDGAEQRSRRPQSWTTPWNGTYQPIRTKYAENDACEHVPVAVAKNGVQIRAVQVSANALRAGPGLATSQIAVSLPQEGYISRSELTLRRFGRKGALYRDNRAPPLIFERCKSPQMPCARARDLPLRRSLFPYLRKDISADPN